MSLGAYPEVSLDEARVSHLRLCADVAEGKDPVGERRKGGKAPVVTPSGAPTFGHCADQHIALNEGGWKNSKHHAQWVATLKTYAAPIRSKPVNEITTADVLAVLTPIWNDKPETASRLRGRIEAVLASAQVDGWIPEDRPNPARWKNWLDRKLPAPKKIGTRGHHAAMPFDQVPAFMTRLRETPGIAVLALQTTILTALRTSELLGMVFDEINFDTATLSIPKERMKMDKPHRVPLSAPALAILRDLYETRGQNPARIPRKLWTAPAGRMREAASTAYRCPSRVLLQRSPKPASCKPTITSFRPEARQSVVRHEHGNAPSPDEGRERDCTRLSLIVPRLGRGQN